MSRSDGLRVAPSKVEGRRAPALLLVFVCAASCAERALDYDVLIRNGRVFDGSGQPPVVAAVAIDGDRIAAIGPLEGATARITIDANGLAVAPGFINMLSWADEPLLVDPRSQSDIRQGVTLEVFGEGISLGPLNDAMKKELIEQQGDSGSCDVREAASVRDGRTSGLCERYPGAARWRARRRHSRTSRSWAGVPQVRYIARVVALRRSSC